MSGPAIPFPQSPVVPAMVEASHEISFQCRRGIDCWNACCSNIDITLTPYDVVRLKRRLGISSTQFLRDYTVPYEMEKDGIAGVKFRPADSSTACRFMTAEGCGVYSDRPTACRYYPVALLSMRKQDEATDRDSYALVREEHCHGHSEPRTISIKAYREEQGLPEFDDLARGWRQLVLKKKSSGPSLGAPSLRSRQLYFMSCYDIDVFREFVGSESFESVFALTDEEKQALADDVDLLQFAFRFLKQVLFGEQSIPLKEEAAKARQAALLARRMEEEREAAAKLQREEEGPAGADEGFD